MTLAKSAARLAFGLALAAGISTAAAAQSLVVRSTGPSAAKYPAGTKMKAADKITLVAGDRVIVLDKGTTRTLSGPGSFSASGKVGTVQTTGTTLTRFISAQGSGRSRGGFTRGPGDEGVVDPAKLRSPNLWVLDFRRGGTFCVADPVRLLAWRADSSADALLKIESGEGAAKQDGTLAFLADNANRRWPTELVDIAPNRDYKLSGAGLAAPVTVRFAMLDALPDTVDGVAAALSAKGCTGQLDQLVDVMVDSEAATPAG